MQGIDKAIFTATSSLRKEINSENTEGGGARFLTPNNNELDSSLPFLHIFQHKNSVQSSHRQASSKALMGRNLALFLPLLRWNNVHKMKRNKKASCLRCPLSASHIHAKRVITLITKVDNKLALFKIQWQCRQKSNTCIL